MGRQQMAVLHPVHGYKIKPQENLKTIKRNQRERSRVETVNRGFESLRLQIPRAAAMGKLSKMGILGEAVDYIQYLHSLLNTNTNLHQHSFHLPEAEEGYYSDVQMSPSSPPMWIPAHNEAQYSPQCSPDKAVYSHQTEQQYRVASEYSPEKQYSEACQYSPPQCHSSSPDKEYSEGCQYSPSQGHSSSPPHSFNTSMGYESWPKTDNTKEDIIDSIVEWQHN